MSLSLAARLRSAGGASLQAFDVPGYSSLWLANVSWNVARWIEQIAVGWITLELTHSAFLVALIGFYRSVPLFLLGAFGGMLGDRFDRRLLVILLQAVNEVVVVVLATLTLTGRLQYTHLAVGEVLLGTSMALDWPSRRSLTVDLVGRERLANAVALDASGQNLSRLVGPLVSGGVIALLSPGVALALLGVLYLTNLALIRRFPRLPVTIPAAQLGGAFRTARRGFGQLLRDPVIVGVLLITVWMNFCYFPYQQLLPVVAVDVLHSGPAGLGLLSAADGFGSLVGTLLLGAFAGHRRNSLIFGVGSLIATMALFGFSQVHTFLLAVLMLILAGLARSGFSVYQTTIILRQCSDVLRGRAMGILTLAIGVGPFGQLEMGAAAQSLGTPIAIGANAVVCAVLTATVLLRSKRFRDA